MTVTSEWFKELLDDVAVDLAPAEHAVLQHQQTLFQQDDVGRLTRDVGRRIKMPTSAARGAGAALMPSPK